MSELGIGVLMQTSLCGDAKVSPSVFAAMEIQFLDRSIARHESLVEN